MAGLREFVVEFGSEEKCIEHLAGLRWPGGFACAGCGGRQAWRLKARPRVYECAACHRQESVTAGTVDSNHRSPSEIVVDPSGSRRDHRAKYCPPGKTQHLLPNSVFDRPGSDRWNLASTTFPDAGTDASNPVPSSGERRDAMGRAARMATSSLHQPMECRNAPAERLEQVPRRPGPK